MCRYDSFYYKAQSWKYSQRVIAKVDYNGKGEKVRFVVTSNRNNTPKTVYRQDCLRGKMELWIKDLKFYIVEKKTFIRLSFSSNHRHRSMMAASLKRKSAKPALAQSFIVPGLSQSIGSMGRKDSCP